MNATFACAFDSLGHNLATNAAGRRQTMGSEGFTVLDGELGGSFVRARAPGATPSRNRQARRFGQRSREAVPARQSGPSEAEHRLEALQRQTAVLTHDFNNLLNVILAANEALGAQFAEGSQARELADISQDAAEKGAELLRRLADLSAPAAQADPLIDCGETVAATARLARTSSPASVTVAAHAAEEPLLCLADQAALDSALLNLCVNASHAMPHGGALAIAATAAELDMRAARSLDLPPGRYVALSVADTGVGMSPETLARATERYFTTRRARGGTGLGLANVQDFAHRAGGRLALASQPGRGTTATLYLPRV
jgi:signal transduction histidine kinase